MSSRRDFAGTYGTGIRLAWGEYRQRLRMPSEWLNWFLRKNEALSVMHEGSANLAPRVFVKLVM